MTTIAELIKQEPLRIEKGITMLNGCYYNHIKDIEEHLLDSAKYKDGFAIEVEQRIYHEAIYDVRRSQVIFGVFYKDKPVMICRNAGRELDDFSDTQIIDADHYKQIINYIREELVRVGSVDTPEIVAMDTVVEFEFYGHDVRQPYN